MAFKIIETYTRTSPSTKWYQYPADHAAIINTLIAEKKMDLRTATSPNRIVQTVTVIFNTQEEWDSVINNPLLVSNFTARDEYNVAHNIIKEIAVTEI